MREKEYCQNLIQKYCKIHFLNEILVKILWYSFSLAAHLFFTKMWLNMGKSKMNINNKTGTSMACNNVL